jgi:hypothetical protein
MLYWGEGEKSPKNSKVKLANSDPRMIRFFYTFLKDVLKIQEQRINIYLLLYPDLADEMQKNLWSKSTGIPLSQFKKTIYINGKHPTKRISYGVGNIYLNNRELKEKIMKWIELYSENLV